MSPPRRLVGLAAAATVAHLVAARRVRWWGAARSERDAELPGDELVPRPAFTSTRAVSVGAPAAEVWPWLAQIGQDRAGFYSHRRLENLIGCRMPDTDRVHPEWQHRDVGEPLPIHPRMALPVARFEPGRAIVVRRWAALVVEPDGPDACRVIVRNPRGMGTVGGGPRAVRGSARGDGDRDAPGHPEPGRGGRPSRPLRLLPKT